MKAKNIKTVLIASLVIVAIVAAYLSITWQKAEAKSKNWVGSWNTEITVVNQNATFPGLITFYSDGNMITDETPSPLETSGHGSWVSTGKNGNAYTFVFLIGNTEPGLWIKGTLNGQVAYDPNTDTWNGPFTIQLVDQDGNVVLDDTGTMNSTRITAVP